MDKQVFSASSITKILDLSATAEVVGAIESAVSRGIMTTDDDFASTASWWRHENGFLFATHAAAIVPGARRVELQWECDDGFRAAA
ncbi:MAG: hypothetical protein EA420_00455 [Candidatus Competibacteraceae bacterium]|jgi:hypothetical protein|nr:MAG: hypothetical protein EA420_00455 [Candidatus Competibacteraceae bacterium]